MTKSEAFIIAMQVIALIEGILNAEFAFIEAQTIIYALANFPKVIYELDLMGSTEEWRVLKDIGIKRPT